MQLVAYGAQDVYLTGQPKVTFFQAVYKRYTNFAMEAIQQTVNGSATNSSRVSVTIARNGDLVGDMWLQMKPLQSGTTLDSNLKKISTNTALDTNWLAERAISAVELTIGGQRIDKHYQQWFRLYSEVFNGDSKKLLYDKMTSLSVTENVANLLETTTSVFLPLVFFFNRNPGLYLPLIALQYHEVRLDFDLTAYYTNYFGTNPVSVWANYVYLDTEERRRFAQKGHEYLIEQVQYTGGDTCDVGSSTATTKSSLIRLTFNHPVKELIWCYQSPNFGSAAGTETNAMWNFSTGISNVNVSCNVTGAGFLPVANSLEVIRPNSGAVPRLISGAAASPYSSFWTEDGFDNSANSPQTDSAYTVGPLSTFKLVLNGQDRFAVQPGKYFNQYQPYQYHSGCPYPGIYVYSFALKPEEHQPSGTCNFSRIDNAQANVSLKALNANGFSTVTTTLTQRMFAVNYNILRIQSGMGGLAFSN
jgi:hypothetical protein